jgi:phage regulator Rha-like protein
MHTLLIVLDDKTPVVSHRVVAENTGNEIKSVARIISTHLADFEEFGRVGFKIAPLENGQREGMSTAKTYLLNEQQATLLMTYLKNTEIVRTFKKALVKAFYDLRDKPNQKYEEIILAQNTTIAMLQRELDSVKSTPKQIEHKPKACQKCKDYRFEIDQLRYENTRYKSCLDKIEAAETLFQKWAQMLHSEFTAKAQYIHNHLHGEMKYGNGAMMFGPFLLSKKETIEGIHDR